ncbi:hypothetical protein NEDG_01653 [Nematocida displodere]|uniref:separase n=1 Tax=Nematocida displodere TaxID=1805483 RepID=A0A177EIL4_9MICR|nr:hypothetical protein NEDG_01653 [Nematocida displodere]
MDGKGGNVLERVLLEGADRIVTYSPLIFAQMPLQFEEILRRSCGLSHEKVAKLGEELKKYSIGYFYGEGMVGEDEKAARAPETGRASLFRAYHQRAVPGPETDPSPSPSPETDLDGLFLGAYGCYVRGAYQKARDLVERMLELVSGRKKVHFGCKLHILSLGASASHKLGLFYDAMYLARGGKSLSAAVSFSGGESYFEEVIWVLETTAGVQRTWHWAGYALISEKVEKRLEIGASLEDKVGRSVKYATESTLLRDVKIYDSREARKLGEARTNIEEYILEIKGIGKVCTHLSPVMAYTIEGCLAFGLIFIREEKTKMTVIKTNISVTELLYRMYKINEKNREVLKRRCIDPGEKKQWWADRAGLDRAIKKEVMGMNAYLARFQERGHVLKERVVLVVEDVLGGLPLEMAGVFQGKGVVRSSSLFSVIREFSEISDGPKEPKDFFYLLNPEKNLPRTEERVEAYLAQELPGIAGIKGRAPSPLEIEQAMQRHQIFLYFGHGGGEKFFTPQALTHATPPHPASAKQEKKVFLFGCSSARLKSFRHYNTHSTCLSYLYVPGIHQVVGALWDITDKDLDGVSLGLVRAVKGGGSVSAALGELRRGCKLKYLNGGALVVYGGS